MLMAILILYMDYSNGGGRRYFGCINLEQFLVYGARNHLPFLSPPFFLFPFFATWIPHCWPPDVVPGVDFLLIPDILVMFPTSSCLIFFPLLAVTGMEHSWLLCVGRGIRGIIHMTNTHIDSTFSYLEKKRMRVNSWGLATDSGVMGVCNWECIVKEAGFQSS